MTANYLRRFRDRYAQVQGPQAHVASLPPPVGGWNARDALANMPPTDAVVLTNLFPGVSSCDLRGGCVTHASGMSGRVETLMNFSGGTVNKLFAIDSIGKTIHDVTVAGPVGAPVVSGLSNARWEHSNITTPGGHFLMAVNGLDRALLYSGTPNTWTPLDAVSVPPITGVATTALSNVLLFKNRLWFIEKGTLRAWYLPPLSVGGALNVLDMSAIAGEGGFLVDMIQWTIDSGTGVDDELVFITNKGQVIVWRGTDPASSATWTSAGVWDIGAPVGSRSMLKFGGDALVLTLAGLLPMAAALQSSRLDPRVALTDKIQGAISQATSTFGQAFGWQILHYPKQNAVWVNVPLGENLQQQYVMNTITGAWCNFENWPANCWEIFNDEPYFGDSNGRVHNAWHISYIDHNDQNINGFATQAFNYFDQRGVEKYFTRARPNIITTGFPSIKIGMAIDFNLAETVTPITFSPTAYAVWDFALWDAALWGQSLTLQSNWQGIAGIGYCGGVQLQTASQGLQIKWASTDVVFQAGWAGI